MGGSRSREGRAFRALVRGDTPRRVAAAALRDDPDPFVRELCAAVAGGP